MRQSGPALAVKRSIDLVLAGSALVILSPVMTLIALAILATMGRPVLFAQPRPGRGGRIFTMFKFRTMRPSSRGTADVATDGMRITRVGRFLRATSLDELPELFNVFQGSMSLVGPRPLLVAYLDRYSPEQRRRHDVLPGITGWAQINGRNATTWEDRFRHDVWYVDHWSPLLDLRILLRTVAPVLARRGISREGHATMPEFGVPSPTPEHRD